MVLSWETALIITTFLIGLISAIFDLKTSKLIVKQKGDRLIETEVKNPNFWGYAIIGLTLTAMILAMVSKGKSDEKEVKNKVLSYQLLRLNNLIEPINIHYRIIVKLDGLPSNSSFSQLVQCIDQERGTADTSVYVDSNSDFLKPCLSPGNYTDIFAPDITLVFCEKLEEWDDMHKSLHFLTVFHGRTVGTGTQDLKLEITYKRPKKEFEIYYITNSEFNMRKGSTKKIISTLDLTNKFVMCSGFNMDGAILKEIIIQTGPRED